jgi:hypothetical protein
MTLRGLLVSGFVSVVVVGAAAGCAALAANRDEYARPSKEVVMLVNADGTVMPEHAVVLRNQEAHWHVCDGTVTVVFEKGTPVDLDNGCGKGQHCVGKPRRDARSGQAYKYHVVVNGKPGPDPYIIIKDP